MRHPPGTLAALVARALEFGDVAPTLGKATSASARKKKAAGASLAPPAPNAGAAPRASTASPAEFLASQLDLRASVQLAEALAKKPHWKSSLAGDYPATLAAAIDTLANVQRQIDAVRVADAHRARALSAASILGTLRGAGALDDVTGAGIARATRSLWAPFATWITQQLATADRAIDAVRAEIAPVLAARSPADARLVQLDALFESACAAAQTSAFDKAATAIERSFARALTALIVTLPTPPTEHDVAPTLLPEGLFSGHFALAEQMLRARVRHRVRGSTALFHGARVDDSV